jgi:hypothetical protein
MMGVDIQKNLLTFYQVLLAVIYFSAGLNKFFNFPHLIGPPWLIEELDKYGLGLFGYFIALAQIFVGGFLFFMRYRLIACLMLLPMHICVFIVPISLGWQGTPYINAVLLYMLLHLIFSERDGLIQLFQRPMSQLNTGYNVTYWTVFVFLWMVVILPWAIFMAGR